MMTVQPIFQILPLIGDFFVWFLLFSWVFILILIIFLLEKIG